MTTADARVFVGKAPGKVILLGEHSVVYGYRAIATAVNLYTTVRLRERAGPTRIEDSTIQDVRLETALGTVLPAEGLGVEIESELPIGCGMGSSAALAVATVRAAAAREGRKPTFAECYERAFRVERIFHGNPSGLDHAVSTIGGPVIYRRGQPADPLVMARPIRLVVANTGKPGNTAEMVALVKSRNMEAELLRLGALTEMAAARLATGACIGGFMTEAHRLLRRIGVSTSALDELVRVMLHAGARGAKLAGAGGGGIVIALVDGFSEDDVREAAESVVPGNVYAVTVRSG
jgi:mevalonate kinase